VTPRLWLGGEWVGTATTVPVRDPFTGETVAEAPLGGPAELRRAIDAAHAAFPAARDTAPDERATRLQRLATALASDRAGFAALLVREAGKPVILAEAEVDRAVVTFAAAAEEARRSAGPPLDVDAWPTARGRVGLARRFPLGVVYALTPFNFPLNLVAHKIAPVLASGNTLVLKPSPRTPLTALRLAGLLEDCGVPPGQVNVVTCANEQAATPLDDPRVRLLSFTGSAAVGWELQRRAAGRRSLLELGGNAPVIVHEDADLATAVPAIAAAAFGYAGQSCISVQRILVHAPVARALRQRLAAHVACLPVGDPRRRDVLVGPLIDAGARERLLGWIRSALAAGARLLAGGEVAEGCLRPTLLEGVPGDHPLARDEAFGPVAVVQDYATFAEALAMANATPFGLQAGVFTRDLGRVWQAFRTLEFGAVHVGDVPTFRADHLPYGGVKSSGLGREGVRWAIEEMTELRTLLFRTS
jgi:acyl-CoA reductase-like NAD-dependent aldehyde dehydrogenase